MRDGGESELVAALRAQHAAWRSRPLVRELYREWFAEIAVRLSHVPGRSVELGAGIAQLSEIVPDVAPTDVEPTPWTTEVVDAERMPFAEGSVANLVLVDVYHHLASTGRFLSEAQRVLAPGGRVLVLDPYCSPVSRVGYGLFHHERVDLTAVPFADDESLGAHPLSSNQARATLELVRAGARLETLWPDLRVVETLLLALIAYPLSGGFTGRRLVPVAIGSFLRRSERRLTFVAPICAHRCLVVLERR
jgi:SAM-dependent methyltransferase